MLNLQSKTTFICTYCAFRPSSLSNVLEERVVGWVGGGGLALIKKDNNEKTKTKKERNVGCVFIKTISKNTFFCT